MRTLRLATMIVSAFLCLAGPAQARNFAFLVACGDYDPAELKPVPFTLNEMNLFRDALVNTGTVEANIVYLHDKTDRPARMVPNRANILREYKLLLERLRPDDAVIIALSGHGIQYKTDRSGYFCPVDARLGPANKQTLLPMEGDEGLLTLLAQCKAGRKLVVINACRNDPAAGTFLAAQKLELRDDYSEEAPKGTVILFACGKGQRSYFYADMDPKAYNRRNRSLFMFHLTEAWLGRYAGRQFDLDGNELPGKKKVTLDHVISEVTERVETDAVRDFRNNQIPVARKTDYEGSWLLVREPGQVDLADTAKELAPKIAAAIVDKQGADKYRVGIFAPADEKGRVTLKTAQSSLVLQGELIEQVTRAAKGKFFVLDKTGLAREFLSNQVDPAGISQDDPRETGRVLGKLGIDAAVLCSFNKNRQGVEIDVIMIFKDGSVRSLTGASGHLVSHETDASGRFAVDILMKNSLQEWVPIPLVGERSNFTAFFAEIPRNIKLNTKQAAYKIRIKNRGTPYVRFNNSPENDRARLYAVSVQIDGVNSFYQKRADGSIGPLIAHAKNVRRWILSGPNYVLTPDTSSSSGFRLSKTSGLGHSALVVPGFQKDSKTADEFIFANARESLASSLGITSSIGVITVNFYPQDLKGDIVPSKTFGYELKSGIGTKAGATIANPIFTINQKFKPEPVETWTIFYRQEGSLPFGNAQLIKSQ